MLHSFKLVRSLAPCGIYLSVLSPRTRRRRKPAMSVVERLGPKADECDWSASHARADQLLERIEPLACSTCCPSRRIQLKNNTAARDVVRPIETATLKLLPLLFFPFAAPDCLESRLPSRDPLPFSASLIIASVVEL